MRHGPGRKSVVVVGAPAGIVLIPTTTSVRRSELIHCIIGLNHLMEERDKKGFVVLLILCIGSCCSSKPELSNDNYRARIRAEDLDAIAKLLHKSGGSACMKGQACWD